MNTWSEIKLAPEHKSDLHRKQTAGAFGKSYAPRYRFKLERHVHRSAAKVLLSEVAPACRGSGRRWGHLTLG